MYIFILLRPTEFADPIETIPSIPFDDDITPYSTIPMVYSDQPLLSDWPEEYLKKIYRQVSPVCFRFCIIEEQVT